MKYLLLLIIFTWVGCKSQQKEPPYEFITFFPSVSTLNSSDGIHQVNMKRYLSESIEDMMMRTDTLFGMKLLGRWIGNDSIVFNRIDSNIFTVDTIRSVSTATSGFDYNWETSDMPLRVPVGSGIKLGGIIQYNTAINDTTLKSVWTDGVQLSPKSSKQFDKDTIYIYRDTCTLRGIASGSTMILYADDSGNLTAPTDTIIYRKLKQQ